MESFIKEAGIASMRTHATEAIEKQIKDLALEANGNLINAAYAESLLPSVDEQVKQYDALIEKTNEEIANIEEAATHATSAQEGYNIRKEKKPLEAKLRAYDQGRQRMLERKASALEKINAHRFDAQANMHRIEFIKGLTGDAVVDTLVKHIENQQPKAAEEEAAAVIAEENATETPEETPTEPTPETPTEEVKQ